jgi:L-lactate utilization protein LutB
VQNSKNTTEVDGNIKKLRSATQAISDCLMNAEMLLTEQFEQVLEKYKDSVTEISNTLTEFGMQSFMKMRELAKEHSEILKQIFTQEYEKSVANGKSNGNTEVSRVRIILIIDFGKQRYPNFFHSSFA